jgi:NhaP-type Na+/H+ or K+/H+ antiporter
MYRESEDAPENDTAMELTIIVIVSVVAIVAVASVSQRIAVAVPLSLVVVGIALSFLPGLPKIDVDPKWILAGALPPLLYATAVRMPAHDFRRDFKAIAGLAVEYHLHKIFTKLAISSRGQLHSILAGSTNQGPRQTS